MRRILVAIDGSEGSMRALDFAARQASYAPAAELHVLTIQPAAAANTAWEIYVSAERLQEIAAERSRDILASASERLKGANFGVQLEQRAARAAGHRGRSSHSRRARFSLPATMREMFARCV